MARTKYKSSQLLFELVLEQLHKLRLLDGPVFIFLLLFFRLFGDAGNRLLFGIEVFMNEVDDFILVGIQGFNVVVQLEEVGGYFILQIVYFCHLPDAFTGLGKLVLGFYQLETVLPAALLVLF